MSRPRLAVLVCGIAALSSCDPGGSAADRSGHAARADSSAAGYAVGAGVAPSPLPPPTSGTTATRPALRDARAAAADSGRRASRTASAPIDSTGPQPTPASVTVPPLPVGLARVNEFLSYDAQARMATLVLVAGYNGLNGGLNYNGGARGSQGVSVPLGWKVHVTVTNRDSDLQHSAIVIRQVLPPPEEMPAPAFAGAMLAQLEEGMHEDDTARLEFVVDRTGRFMIACGVPGHAQGGMWLRLTVGSDIDRPVYR